MVDGMGKPLRKGRIKTVFAHVAFIWKDNKKNGPGQSLCCRLVHYRMGWTLAKPAADTIKTLAYEAPKSINAYRYIFGSLEKIVSVPFILFFSGKFGLPFCSHQGITQKVFVPTLGLVLSGLHAILVSTDLGPRERWRQ
jgi:hypothetical protein